jgi:hypothetical protein
VEKPFLGLGRELLGELHPGPECLLPQVSAGTLATDPNALQKIKEFIYKPKPDDLVIKPQGHEAEEAA